MPVLVPPVPATPGFAQMTTPAPVDVPRSTAASIARWVVGGAEVLAVGMLLPLVILVVGVPIVLLVRLLLSVTGLL